MADSTALINSDLPGLTLVSKGKVRDIYSTSSPEYLLFVASDRISAYDVILRNGVPEKGKLLTQISLFWFEKLKDIIPNHFVTANVQEMPEEVRQYKDQLEGRAMLVRKAQVVPLEAIVRGYLTGSGWAEYKKSGTVHGIPLPSGLVESQKLPEPLFTPSTKAEQGAHDENISPETAAKLIGEDLYSQISSVAIQLYKTAASYAESRGLILADTKFEFGLVPSTTSPSSQQLILVDEVLTPDSSRYWPLEGYAPGRGQPSFDKQYLRDWLVQNGFKKGLEGGANGEGWTMTPEVVEGTRKRYVDVVKMLMGEEVR
ncbi:SAICAR synthetase [Gloeophyllum trabeum ATCC 11539]|uniref:Phosphoribosylaminoimidazole-succinocarboxamide synthase n=1 Tax=Gloeophyllum trabeum (strain ATCC 11539 / FP-39264 / Madison 617) TaxID=670483 RepID=S7QB40_GLOTA|nr:SAICAR synthetase [Gloeophyllum trabeum ATCC 11539]EPQ56548.1 SAICAR synthetase [Gloeophyllum trabeum ATCC 11539]